MSKTRGGGQSQLGQQQMDDNYLENIMNKVCAKIVDKLDKRFDKIESKIDELSNRLGATDNMVQCNTNEINIMKNKLDDMEQLQKKNALRFDGIKEGENEGLIKIICNIVNSTMKIKCSLVDIDDVYRIGKSNMQENLKPRTVLVKFVSHVKRDEVIKARKTLKNTGIFVNEDLTSKQYKLQLMTKKIFGAKNVWTWGGRVYINHNDSVKIIKNENDLKFNVD